MKTTIVTRCERACKEQFKRANNKALMNQVIWINNKNMMTETLQCVGLNLILGSDLLALLYVRFRVRGLGLGSTLPHPPVGGDFFFFQVAWVWPAIQSHKSIISSTAECFSPHHDKLQLADGPVEVDTTQLTSQLMMYHLMVGCLVHFIMTVHKCPVHHF